MATLALKSALYLRDHGCSSQPWNEDEIDIGDDLAELIEALDQA
ncbi:hypothetical protein [Gloeobacter morelensis]|nr:hypothetical protein [Gloeobacter morelensis]